MLEVSNKKLLVKRVRQVQSVIESNPDVTGVTVKLSPFFVDTVPTKNNKITITIAKPTTQRVVAMLTTLKSVLSLDVGAKRVGIAVATFDAHIASSLITLPIGRKLSTAASRSYDRRVRSKGSCRLSTRPSWANNCSNQIY